jgi:hypothetical protein
MILRIHPLSPRLVKHLSPSTACVAIRTYTRAPAVSSSPSPKISAIPFRQTPSIAQERMFQTALINTVRPSNILYALGRRLFGDFATEVINWLGIKTDLKMIDMKAIYWPIWVCDVVLEGKVKNKYSQDKVEASAWVGIEEMYVPGMSFAWCGYVEAEIEVNRKFVCSAVIPLVRFS